MLGRKSKLSSLTEPLSLAPCSSCNTLPLPSLPQTHWPLFCSLNMLSLSRMEFSSSVPCAGELVPASADGCLLPVFRPPFFSVRLVPLLLTILLHFFPALIRIKVTLFPLLFTYFLCSPQLVYRLLERLVSLCVPLSGRALTRGAAPGASMLL